MSHDYSQIHKTEIANAHLDKIHKQMKQKGFTNL